MHGPEGLHRKTLNPKPCFRYYIHRVHLDLVCSVLGVAVWIAQSLVSKSGCVEV